MAYKYNGKIIRAGRAWSDDNGTQHPRNWMVWSDAEKTAAGLVWEDDPAPFDSRFYWAADLPKALDDVNEVDEDGNSLLDEDGNQVVTLGLKSQYKAQTKVIAGSLLAPTDWHVVKAAEVEAYSVPADVSQFRTDVRAASNTIEAAIDGAADLDAFMALFNAPEDGTAPINDWPEEV